jgi:hypothetical protein
MPRLVDIEVEEVSLVDRPATGRRFRIFKRNATGGFLNRLLGTYVPNSTLEAGPTLNAEPTGSPAEGDSSLLEITDRLAEPEAVLKRLEEAFDLLAEHQQEIQKRLERLEEAPRTRQSSDPDPSNTGSLWKGVLA